MDFNSINNSSKNRSPQQPQSIHGAKPHILLLAVDIKLAQRLMALLKTKYVVHSINNPTEGLNILKNQKIAIVISEQALPNIDITGTDFIKKTKSISPNSSRIVLAGLLDYHKAKTSLEMDDVFKLIKLPFDDNQLLLSIEEATLLYLEQSGTLANAMEKLKQHAPNFNKDIQLSPRVSASSNAVIIKTPQDELFHSIQSTYKDTAYFIQAYTKEDTIEILKRTITKVLIYCLDHTEDILRQPETIFIKQIKQELPHLSIIIILNNSKTNYQEIINFLNEKIIYNYFPAAPRVDKVCTQLSLAIEQANKLYTDPLLLHWPPAERVDIEKENVTENISDKLDNIATKITDNFTSGIQTLKKLFKKAGS